jgi:hypothetical protein
MGQTGTDVEREAADQVGALHVGLADDQVGSAAKLCRPRAPETAFNQSRGCIGKILSGSVNAPDLITHWSVPGNARAVTPRTKINRAAAGMDSAVAYLKA